MYNNNYEEENFDYSKELLDPRYNYLNQSANELYNKDRRYFPKTNYKNIESNISTLNIPPFLRTPQKFNSNNLRNSTKAERFQNENSTVYRVSPYHYQYISRINNDYNNDNKNSQINENYYEDNDNREQSYNFERERQFRYYNQFLNSKTINRHQNFLERNLIYNRNYINNRNYDEINSYKEKPNRYYLNKSNEFSFSRQNQISKRNYVNKSDRTFHEFRNNLKEENNNNYKIRRSNSDLSFIYNRNNNRYLENNRYDNQSDRYEMNNLYNNDERKGFEKRVNYYNPKRGDYKCSRFGDYTYNYYLNSPMRGDISEDWKFPPIYHYRQNINIRNKLYSSSNDLNEFKNNFFNENF